MTRVTALLVLEDDAASARDTSRLVERMLAEAGFDVRFILITSRSVVEDRARQVVADLDAAAVAYLQWSAGGGS
jgi:GR25 family glycosyltransferase involved in LPS biosynthesis